MKSPLVRPQLADRSYEMFSILFSPHDMGIPSIRYRKYTTFHLKGVATLLGKGSPRPNEWRQDSFRNMFFRKVVVDARIYMVGREAQRSQEASEPEIIVEEAEESKEVDHVGNCTDNKTLLSLPSIQSLDVESRLRLLEYMSIARESRASGSSSTLSGVALCNLFQNASFNSAVTDLAPTLLKKSVLFDLMHCRPVPPRTHWLIQGFPLPGVASPTVAEAFPFPEMWLDLNDVETRAATGNSMHLAAVGSMLTFAIAASEFLDIV